MILILLLSYQYVVERLNLEQSKVAKVSLDTYHMYHITLYVSNNDFECRMLKSGQNGRNWKRWDTNSTNL